MDADGSERYSRCAKSIVQVGPPGAGLQGQVNKPLGLPLEIVPEANPYGAKRLATLPVRVLYAGHALAGDLGKPTKVSDDAPPLEAFKTHRGRPANLTRPRTPAGILHIKIDEALPPFEVN